MTEKLVSIALATYNGEKFLVEQLDSIINQTYKNIEIIICDDKSIDSTVSIITNYANSDKRISLYENDKNLGYIKNFEKAISLCNGEYIALSDQDDIWMLNKISTLVKEIGNSLLIHSDANLIDDKSSLIGKSYTEYSKKMTSPKSIIDMILNGSITGCTCLFSSSLLQKIIPFPHNIDVHDKWIGIIAYYFGNIKYINIALIKYRQHSNNMIGAQDITKASYVSKVKSFLLKNKNNLLLNEKKILLLLHILLNDSNYRFSKTNKFKIELLINYYENVINSILPLRAFFVRLLLFSNFERSKPLKHKLFALFAIYKNLFFTLGQYFVSK
jgi:glycosyltransferase involved in cell wall biosynthesis